MGLFQPFETRVEEDISESYVQGGWNSENIYCIILGGRHPLPLLRRPIFFHGSRFCALLDGLGQSCCRIA